MSDADSQARVVFLGTAGGPIVAEHTHGIATAFVLGEDVYLIDAGLGVVNQYVDAGLRLDRLRAVLLTHMHGDHVADLFNLFMFGAKKVDELRPGIADPVTVIGPGPTAASQNGVEPHGQGPFPGVAGLFEHNYAAQAATLASWARAMPLLHELVDLYELPDYDVRDVDVEPFTVLENGAVTIRAVVVPHMPTSYAYRIDSVGGSVVFSGDTGPSAALAGLARGADVLVHEILDIDAMIAEGFPEQLRDPFTRFHTDISDVGRIATAAGVPTLVLNHFIAPRATPPQRWIERIGKDYDGQVILAEDLMSLRVRPGAPAQAAQERR